MSETDYQTTEDRLGPLIDFEQPRWITELLTAAGIAMGIGLLTALSYVVTLQARLDEAQGERELWMEFALQPVPPETGTLVRIDPEGDGFRCSHQGVRREWEVAVAAECQVMGALLHMARASE